MNRSIQSEGMLGILKNNRWYKKIVMKGGSIIKDLKNTSCILISSYEQQNSERSYYHDVFGFQGEILFADNIEEARLMVISGKGFLPIEGSGAMVSIGTSITRIPLYQGEKQITRNYCAF